MQWLKWGLNNFLIIWDYYFFKSWEFVCLHRSLSTLSQSHKFRSRCPTLTRSGSRSPTKRRTRHPWSLCRNWQATVCRSQSDSQQQQQLPFVNMPLWSVRAKSGTDSSNRWSTGISGNSPGTLSPGPGHSARFKASWCGMSCRVDW